MHDTQFQADLVKMKRSVYIHTTDRFKKLVDDGHEEACVAFSGGKDSLVVMDMACKVFRRVVPFYMFLCEGLQQAEDALRIAKTRWGVEVLRYPSWVLYHALSQGVYCDPNDGIAEPSFMDIWDWVIEDTKIELILTGEKVADNLWRQRNLLTRKKYNYETVVVPIIDDWSKFDVMAYCRLHKIPLPHSALVHNGRTRNSSGIDLSIDEVLFMRDEYPDDYKKLRKIFPYVEAIVKRRKWFGVQ